MPSNTRISVTLDARGRRPRLEHFLGICEALLDSLENVARVVAGESADIRFEVADLRYGSAVIDVVPIAESAAPPAVLNDVETTFVATIRALQSGESLDRRLDYRAIRAFHGFCPAVRGELSICIAGVHVTGQYEKNLMRLLATAVPSLGSVSGRLETVSIHNRYQFTLYSPIPGEHVQCHFAEAELPRVLQLVGRKLTVFGPMRYTRGKSCPSHVDVERFEEEPEDALLPTLLETKGILPHDLRSADDTGACSDEW